MHNLKVQYVRIAPPFEFILQTNMLTGQQHVPGVTAICQLYRCQQLYSHTASGPIR